jgi:ribosomal protein L37AE/L43A
MTLPIYYYNSLSSVRKCPKCSKQYQYKGTDNNKEIYQCLYCHLKFEGKSCTTAPINRKPI